MREDPLVLGMDIGTQGTKALVVDSQGQIIASAVHSYSFQTPRSGWAEQHPDQWWNASIRTLHDLWNQGISPKQIQGIGVAGQMHSSVVLNDQRQPLGPAILWNDVRTKPQCEWMLKRAGDSLRSITRNSVLPGFTAPKLMWMRDFQPDRYSRIHHVLLPKDYLVYRLSGQLSTDVSDASGTALFDVERRSWSKDLMNEFALPEMWFPAVHESADVVGKVSAAAAKMTGLLEGTPVAAGAADNAAAALGNGMDQPGKGVISVGTSGTVIAPVAPIPPLPDEPGLDTLHVFCHCIPKTWYVMGVTLSAGMSLRWLRDLLRHDRYEDLLEGADTVSPGSDGLMFLPYLNGERTPHNDPDVRGLFAGIHLGHHSRHFARAVMEGVAYSLRDCFDLIQQLPISMQSIRLTGGAAKNATWSQIIADTMGVPITLFEEREGPAYGAALLAGLGTDLWTDVDELPDLSGEERALFPKAENVHHYQSLIQTYRQLYHALKPFSRALQ